MSLTAEQLACIRRQQRDWVERRESPPVAPDALAAASWRRSMVLLHGEQYFDRVSSETEATS